jgi:2-iminobutanoate/2-iminopropanoate deaminase
MSRSVIFSPEAPAPIGPYSQAIQAGNMLFISGQIPIRQSSGEIIKDSIEAQTEQVMINLREILTSAGLDFSNVVKCSIFLTDMNDFPKVNEVYGRFFQQSPPARETVQVSALPKNVNVEISCIAVK